MDKSKSTTYFVFPKTFDETTKAIAVLCFYNALVLFLVLINAGEKAKKFFLHWREPLTNLGPRIFLPYNIHSPNTANRSSNEW